MTKYLLFISLSSCASATTTIAATPAPAATPLTMPAEAEPRRAIDTCFSPDEACDQKLFRFIDAATASIDVAVYDLNLDQIVHALLVKGRKIPVRVIVDQRQAKGRHSLVSTLVRAGADVRYGRQRGIMHDKFVVVDGRALETGSFNFTNHASTANQENQIYLSDPATVDRFRERFERMWATAKAAKAWAPR